MSDLFSSTSTCCNYRIVPFSRVKKKNTSNSPSPRRIRTFATIFFWWLFKQKIGESLLGCFCFYAGKIILVPRLGGWWQRCVVKKKTGDFWSNERSYRTEGITWVVAICFKCSSLFGGNDAIWLAHIFLKGWFDHQLDTYLVTSDWWISGCFFWLRFWSFQKGHFWVVVSKIFYFHPYLGKISNLTNVFQMGWNHQLDLYSFVLRDWDGRLDDVDWIID